MGNKQGKSLFERASLIVMTGAVGAMAAVMALRPLDLSTHAPNAILGWSERPAVEAIPLPPLRGSQTERLTARRLAGAFERLDYSVDAVKASNAEVPRLLLASMPADMHEVPQTDRRKALFLGSVLPLVLEVNRAIEEDRARLLSIRDRRRTGQKVPAHDRLWLAAKAEQFGLSEDDGIATLLRRIDVVPPSLALAQAAVESGWGTSRFAREGNALFGQWTWSDSDKGLVPHHRENGKTHRIKVFDHLIESVAAYMVNLNTHRAYRAFRDKRATLRHTGKTLDGHVLAGTLTRYSELGDDYVRTLRTVITVNGLRDLDDAELRGPMVTAALAP